MKNGTIVRGNFLSRLKQIRDGIAELQNLLGEDMQLQTRIHRNERDVQIMLRVDRALSAAWKVAKAAADDLAPADEHDNIIDVADRATREQQEISNRAAQEQQERDEIIAKVREELLEISAIAQRFHISEEDVKKAFDLDMTADEFRRAVLRGLPETKPAPGKTADCGLLTGEF